MIQAGQYVVMVEGKPMAMFATRDEARSHARRMFASGHESVFVSFVSDVMSQRSVLDVDETQRQPGGSIEAVQ